ncbi:ubiquitin carboxyl-terminal hydrolase 25 [Pyrus x bretschneideri]|uniref:ubiquitin carboxyl-terminal hydrolase 25 n=1 Tax=Pyrus x bretschneideri TaxID=225117 RepID=UPI00202E564E|nr:ubiquitin carboxyl-terminal hydrolase 25 [Pyrus x bretschneideri]
MGLQFQLQMSWQPSLLSQKRKNGLPPLGLRNLGNSCYLNSVLQCLTYTPPLANFCLRKLHTSLCDSSDAERKRDCPFCILEKQIVRSLSLDLSLDAPQKIRSCLGIFAEHFRCGRQEDAHEFLRYVIDACHNTCLRLMKLRRNATANGNGKMANGIGNGETATSTVVKEIFGGALQSQVKCLCCGTESNKVDEIMDISLDVLHCNSLKDALQRFFQPEILDGQNKYKCESCKKLVAARKQMSFLQAPNVLVIQLKRFEGVLGWKIDKSISFEEFLGLSGFVYKTSKDPRPEYKLFGTIVHSGFSPESGHYYAYIKDAIGRWYCCNDSSVSLSTLQKVLSEKVYILFFSRTNQRPALASTASNGVSSHDCNGRETSKILKSALPPKGVQTKPYDVSAVSKVDKVPSSPRMKFNLSGNSISKRASITDNGITVYKNQSLGSNGERSTSTANGKSVYKNQSLKSNEERVPATDNGKIAYKNESCGSNGERTPANDNGKIADNNQLLGTNGERARATDTGKIPYKNQSTGLNGDAKDSVSLEKSEKSLLINRDCLNRDKGTAIVDGNSSQASLLSQLNDVKTEACEGIDTKDRLAARKVPNSSQASLLSRGNGGTGSVKIESCEGIGTKDRLPAGKVPDTSESEKSGLHGRSKVSGSKRKFLDSCILFAPDAQSQAEVEGLKEILKKETSSVLRSCGWLDEVYSFMLSRKKLCSDQVGTTPNSNEVKKLLITDAKSSFLSQIPASLRGDLVKRIQSFSKK